MKASICNSCGVQLPADHDPSRPCPRCLLAVGLGAQGVPDESLSIGALAPKFPQLDIVGRIGRGGMGTVYKARQRDLDRTVALKILSDEASSDPAFAERFQREARALASLTHPNITTVYDFGQVDGTYYLLMEYVDGATLREILSEGRLAPGEALAMVSQMCSALQFAHDRSIVHRDIKPENVLVTADGKLKIVDFGLAKIVGQAPSVPNLTRSDQAMGTWHYMAPEQIERPLEVDHRADIFSMGVVFYELLTGELPLGRFSLPSEKAGVDIRLDEMVLKTLAKEPKNRYQQAEQLKTDMDIVGKDGGKHSATPASSKVAPAPVHEEKPRKRKSGLQIALLVLGIVIGVPLALGCLGLLLFMFVGGRATTVTSSTIASEAPTPAPSQLSSVSRGVQIETHANSDPYNTERFRSGTDAYAQEPGAGSESTSPDDIYRQALESAMQGVGGILGEAEADPSQPFVYTIFPDEAPQVEPTSIFSSMNLEQARQHASKQESLVFIEFFTKSSKASDQLESETWSDPKVVEWFEEHAVAVKLDSEIETALAKEYKVDATPTLLFLNAEGHEVLRLTGYRGPERLLEELEQL